MEAEQSKLLDLRFLTGILFTFYGLILTIYGLAVHPTTASTKWNIDLWWGLVDLAFGVVFLVISRRKPRVED